MLSLPQIVKVHHPETMVTTLVALWLTTVVLVLSLVIHNPISTGIIVKRVLSRPIRPLTRTEYVQNALDRAVVADYIQRQWDKSVKKGEITETVKIAKNGMSQNHVRFEKVGDMTLKEALLLTKCRGLLSKERKATYIEVPLGTEHQMFKIIHEAGRKLSISAEQTTSDGESDYKDLSDLSEQAKLLDSSKPALQLTLGEILPKALDEKLAEQKNFRDILAKNDKENTVTNKERDKAFQAFKYFLVGFPFLGEELVLDQTSWVTGMKTDADTKLNDLEKYWSQSLAKQTKLKFEFIQSMLISAEEAKYQWEDLKKRHIIEERIDDAGNQFVTFHENDFVSLKEVLKLLQFYIDIYPEQKQKQTRFEIPIGGETRKFRLSQSGRFGGKHQIVVRTDDRDWPGATRRGKGKNPLWAPDYDTMVDKVLKHVDNNEQAAKAMVDALNGKLNDQPSFAEKLKAGGQGSPDTVRAAVEFMIVSMVAEAAQPPEELKTNFLTQLTKVMSENRFPEGTELPSLATLDGKAGRSPATDQLVQGMLGDVNKKRKFDEIFTKEEFPARKKSRGAQAAREFIHREGNRDVPSYLIRERAASDHDGEVFIKKVFSSCSDKRRRRRRSLCRLIDKDSVYVDEESVKVTEKMVEFDVGDQRNSELREHVQFALSSNELATPKLIKDNLAKSRRHGASETYVKIHKGLAVHGLIFSALGAAHYFQEGDYVRGSISLTQAVHTFEGLTNIQRRVLSRAAKEVAKSLNFEKGLERFSSKVERFMEKGVGRLLGDIPVVGLSFDVYFIEEDIQELADLDFSDPDDLKLVPLRVIDLYLDVSSTVLNLIGTIFPEAEVIAEPLVIFISIVRMAIDDFYIDIMEEMNNVNWNSPWAVFEFQGALLKGILDGHADFLTGGLRRQLDSYQKQFNYDKKLLRNLKNPDNYFKIVGEKKGGIETIDFTQGELSSFGGYINFRLHDDNLATVEIGDVSGTGKTIRNTFKVDSSLKDIVLGLGESRSFTYKHETAKLWFVIPIKSFDVICGSQLHEESVYGTYYGNSDNNTFYAVQRPKKTEKLPKKKDQECNFGELNLEMLTGNYHYNLYGRGGSDTFYLGPELATVTGGGGSDVYIIQSDGGKTIIDNFAEDDMRDIVVINVSYASIRCHKTGNDVDITYSKSHHIRIKNWFTPGDAHYYRHVSFRSQDGVIFVAEQTLGRDSDLDIHCVAVALDFSGTKTSQTVSLSDLKYRKVTQVSGSSRSDIIVGNDLNNVIDGGRGADILDGGKGEDTYIIRGNEGCDTIENYAPDYLNTTDIVIFDVPFERIDVRITRIDLSVTDRTNPGSSCLTITKWVLGYQYRHLLFTSSDHVVFNVTTTRRGYSVVVSKVPIILDYSASITGVCVDVSGTPNTKCIKPTGFANVATISDSPHNDHIVGNKQTNFLSCIGGNDYLEGGEGSDNYVIKKTCTSVILNNFDNRSKDDVMYLEEMFENLRALKVGSDLKIVSRYGAPAVTLRSWFDSDKYQHLWIRTVDGITLRVRNETAKLDPVELSKDPAECACTNPDCDTRSISFDLSKDPWKHLVRFHLNSSYCSYKIFGNELNNYLDPGAGNGYNYQYLEGRDGSDTYVLKHGYGEFNEINNFAVDNKTDTLLIGLEFKDIRVYFHMENDVVLESNARPSSLGVLIRSYFLNVLYQHLWVKTTDKITFEISKEPPIKRIISIDRTDVNSPQNINPVKDGILASARELKGSLSSNNHLTGSNTTRIIQGGNLADILRAGTRGTTLEGKHGNDTIYGGPNIDIIFAGDGSDKVFAHAGGDFIYAGNGPDVIDGGDGSDTVSFKGDGFHREGVRVDLLFGFGKGADAEGDTYISIENVYGTIHNDTLIGSDYDNSLFGLEGSDTLIAHGGNDKLVGGEGNDLYLLYQASGLKIIDNYADDEIEDTLSLVHLNSTDVCIFLVDNDLHIQAVDLGLAAELLHGQRLTVVIQNWNVNTKYKHLSIVFNNTVWQSFALSDIASRIDQLNDSVAFLERDSRLKVVWFSHGNSVKLSWNQRSQPQGSLSHPNSELLLISFPTKDPTSIRKIKLNRRTSAILPLNASLHYVFALALEKCNAIIAVSHTLTTYGQERKCSAVNVRNSVVQYYGRFSYLRDNHGTIAAITCNVGYTLTQDSDIALNTTCLDGQWIPPLPNCSRIKQCPALRKPFNGYVFTNGRVEGSKAWYVCSKGFLLQGPKERICVGEIWDGLTSRVWCQPLRCPGLPRVDNGVFRSCNYMSYARAVGTFNNPLQGYCVKLYCYSPYLPSHRFHGGSHRPRWDSDWKIPKGGRVCSDGMWIGDVYDKCELTVRLTNVYDYWNKKVGILQRWHNGAWRADSRIPSVSIIRLTCKDVGLLNPSHVSYRLGWTSRLVEVTCSKLRLTQKPTPYEGRLEVVTANGKWEGVCVPTGLRSASKEICESLGFGFKSDVVSLASGWTDHTLSRETVTFFSRLKMKRQRQHCGTKIRCRQKCTNTFHVPQGNTACTGTFEGDSCTVSCRRHYRRRGDFKAYCSGGVWKTQRPGGRPASAHCVSVDTLFKDDVLKLAAAHRGLKHSDLSSLIANRLNAAYPESFWLVTIYDPVSGWDNHAVYGYYFHKFRYQGVNLVVTRYPRERAYRPKVSLATIIGTENGDHSRKAVESIIKKFRARGQSWYCIHAVRKSISVSSSSFITEANYQWIQFKHLVVVVVAP